ncbi:ATP-dependent DNA ligase [Streptomyces sp. NPDC001680]
MTAPGRSCSPVPAGRSRTPIPRSPTHSAVSAAPTSWWTARSFEGSRTSFARLQQRIGIHDPRRARASRVAVTYYVFDVLYLAGHDLTALPLRTRKALVRRALDFAPPLRFTPHRNADGEAYLRQACERGWRASSPSAPTAATSTGARRSG